MAAAEKLRGYPLGLPDGRSLSEALEDVAWNVLSRDPYPPPSPPEDPADPMPF